MVIDSRKIDKKYLIELSDRVGRMAWDIVLAGSSLKVKEVLSRMFKEVVAIRKMMIERKILILDRNLIPTSQWTKEMKEKVGIKEEFTSRFQI